ncbi:MAG: hypothetical protein H6772_03275 [Pseudomonadales bacterium]|nr:hypothetical protein [Pseudomonadales bacterium]
MKSIIHKIKNFKFEKVHYFDLVVVFTILIIFSIFIYNRISRKSIWISARISISDSDLWWNGEPSPYWYINDLSVGMVSYNSFGEEVAKITDLEIYSLGGPNKRAYVDLSLKVSYNKKSQTYLYNFQPIQKGKPIDLTFGSNNVSGLIESLDSEPEQRYQKKIRVKMENIEDWLASSYQEGMEMKDSKGRVLARIESVRVEDSKLSQIKLVGDRIYLTKDQNKDVYAVVTVVAIKDIEGFYMTLDGAAIKIGEDVWFHFPEVVSRAKIIEIIE